MQEQKAPRADWLERAAATLEKGGWPFLGVALLCLAGTLLFEPLFQSMPVATIQIWTGVLVLAVLAVGAYRLRRNTLTGRHIIALLFIIGMILRMGYILYSPYYMRQHDVGTASLSDIGHLAYIQTLIETHSLPALNHYQFYHPPLHHILSAIWAGGLRELGVSVRGYAETLAWLSTMWSGFMMIFSIRLVQRLPGGREGRAGAVAAVALVCLHPTMIILSGSINNDTLLWMCFTAGILALARWVQKPGWSSTLLVGLWIGLAAMAKFSGIVLGLPAAAVMLYCLIKRTPAGERGLRFGQCAGAGIVAALFAFWHPLVNFIRFQQPLGYVMRIDPSEPIYCGDHSLIERFFSIPSEQFSSLFCQPQSDYNLPSYVVKCSVFGEYTYDGGDLAASILLLSNIFLILLSLASMIWIWVKDRRSETRLMRWLLSLVWVTLMGTFIYFNLEYPYGCTMDFRYIVPTVLTGAGFIALAWEKWHGEAKLPRWPLQVSIGLIAVFCISSAWFFLSIQR